MNRRLLSVLAFALVVALVASIAVYRLVLVSLARPQQVAATRTVVFAARDLEVGTLIADADIRSLPCHDCATGQEFTDPHEVVGRGVIATIVNGEPILAPRLAAKGAGAGLASTIPMGKRAVALRVNDVVGLAGFVLPGMRVDVVVSGNEPSSTAGHDTTVTRTVLQDIVVLSAGQLIERRVNGKPESAEVVNLLVTPEQAETLTLASNETKVQLVLRNPLDTEVTSTKGTSLEALLLGADYRPPAPPRVVLSRPQVAAPPPKPVPTESVEIISGVTKREQTFAGH